MEKMYLLQRREPVSLNCLLNLSGAAHICQVSGYQVLKLEWLQEPGRELGLPCSLRCHSAFSPDFELPQGANTDIKPWVGVLPSEIKDPSER